MAQAGELTNFIRHKNQEDTDGLRTIWVKHYRSDFKSLRGEWEVKTRDSKCSQFFHDKCEEQELVKAVVVNSRLFKEDFLYGERGLIMFKGS